MAAAKKAGTLPVRRLRGAGRARTGADNCETATFKIYRFDYTTHEQQASLPRCMQQTRTRGPGCWHTDHATTAPSHAQTVYNPTHQHPLEESHPDEASGLTQLRSLGC